MTTPLWLDPAPAPRAALAGEARADLLVLGLGMTGASAAYRARQRGLDVVAVDAGLAAGGASGRNAGFLLAGPEAYYAEAVARHGRATAREVWTLNRANRDGVADLARRLGLDCDLARTGSVVASVDEAEAEVLRRSHVLAREDGFAAELLDARETAEAAGGQGWTASLLVPDDGMLHPARFVRGLADAAERDGARVHEGTQVLSLARDGDGWLARTPGGAVRARSVVCGLNAYAPALLAWAQERVFPVRGQVLATAPVVAAGSVRRPLYARHGHLYVRPCGGRVVAGGLRDLARASEVGTDDRADPALQAGLERELALRFGVRAPVTHRWSGAMGFSRDALPWIGEVPGEPGLLVAVGYTGHGWGYGVWAGAALADRAAGGRLDVPAWCRADRPLVPVRLAT